MPKLKSGRHFGLEPRSLTSGATTGSSTQMYAFIVAYRLEVQTPDDLANFLPVIYFKEGEGEPPNAPMYRSGFLVKDVLSGKADWSSDEIEELKLWLKTNEALKEWLNANFTEVDREIRNSPLWNSEFMQD